jgi:hypothetical protein
MLSFGVSSVAQFEPLAFAMCKKITADTARLKCYDEINANLDKQQQANAEPPRWTIEEDRSPVDDSLQISAAMKGEPQGSMLVMRCKERKVEAAFVPAGFFMLDSGDRAPVLMRLNDEKPINLWWHKSSNGQAVFVASPLPFMRLLTDGGKLFIRVTGFQGRQADGLFPLADVSNVRNKIEEACNSPTSKSDRPSKPTTTPAAKNK